MGFDDPESLTRDAGLIGRPRPRRAHRALRHQPLRRLQVHEGADLHGQHLLSRDRYTKDRKPPEGTWTVSGDMIIVGTAQMGAARTRSEIPDWILDDTASVASQIGLKLNEVEEFLGRKLRRRRFLLWR